MKHWKPIRLLILAALLSLFALGGCSSPGESVSSSEQALTCVGSTCTVSINVAAGLAFTSCAGQSLREDSGNPSPDLVAATLSSSTLVPNTYNTVTTTAKVGSLTMTECTAMQSCLNTAPQHCKMTVSYDSSGMSSTKNLTTRPSWGSW